jgi:hypothetical protein
MNEAFLIGWTHEYEERFHRLEWDCPDVYGDIGGFLDNRELPDDYGKNRLFRWVNHGNQNEWPDFTKYAPLGWVLISARCAEVLLNESESAEHYQLIEPVFLPDSVDCSHMGYKLLNLRDHLACLDIPKSDVVVDEDGYMSRVHTYVLRHASVEGLMHLFRIKEYPVSIGLSRQLGELLLKSGLTGFSLDPVELV